MYVTPNSVVINLIVNNDTKNKNDIIQYNFLLLIELSHKNKIL